MPKFVVVHLFTVLLCISCKRELPKQETVKIETVKYEIKSERHYSFGPDNQIRGLKKSIDGNYYLLARSTQHYSPAPDCLIRFSPSGDSLGVQHLKDLPGDFIEMSDCFYAIITDRRTMGGSTMDFLNKYDRQWKLLWSKKIKSPKFPDGHTVMELTNKNQLLIISDQSKRVGQHIIVRKFNLAGNLLAARMYNPHRFNNPVSLIRTKDHKFLLAAESRSDENTNCWLAKLDQNGDTVWTREYPDFHVQQALELADSSFLFYGGGYNSATPYLDSHYFLKVLKTDSEGRLLWQKSMDEYYYARPGYMIETPDGHYLFSGDCMTRKDRSISRFLFEMDNHGNLTYSKQLGEQLALDNIPILMRSDQEVIMFSQRFNHRSSNPPRLIFVSKLHQ